MVPELGVIEGYFGRPWRHKDRKRVMSRLHELGYSFFHFAPKADGFLRRQWREPAAQVAMALRMDGFENVRLLYGGFNEWKARGGMEAHVRASKKS